MKTKIPQWILDLTDKRDPGECTEAVEILLSIIKKLEKEIETIRSGKPDWSDTPEWAKYMAQDEDGTYWFLSQRPIIKHRFIEKRPTNEKE